MTAAQSASDDLETFTRLLQSRRTKLIFFVGAGISTAAGIPDFRSPDTGLYHNLEKYNLPYPEAILDLEFFHEEPEPFLQLAKELYPGQFAPTKFHCFMKLIEKRKQLRRVYTQNIDTLERVVGISPKLLVEAHGSFASHHCAKCHAKFDPDKYREAVFKLHETPRCVKARCDGYVKPDIVFYGEDIPKRFDLWKKDLLEISGTSPEVVTITAGTSLSVAPFSSLPAGVPEHQWRVLINTEKVGSFRFPRHKDLVFLKDADVFAEQICEKLGWSDDLHELYLEGLEKVHKAREEGL